jgi:hypothetical protein
MKWLESFRLLTYLKMLILSAPHLKLFRMIKQGAAKIDCKKISDKDFKPELETSVYKASKRKFVLVTI